MLAARLPDTYFHTTCHLTQIFIPLVTVMNMAAVGAFQLPMTRSGIQSVELCVGQVKDRKKATSLV